MTPHERARAMLPDWVKRENDNALTAAWIEGYAAATAEHPPAPPFHEIARYGEADIGKQPAPIGRVWGSLPDDHEAVEILVGGEWVAASFIGADCYPGGPDHDEIWWHDHFQLEDFSTVPENTQDGGRLPPRRRKTGE